MPAPLAAPADARREASPIARSLPPGWQRLEAVMVEHHWRIEVFANPNTGGFTARMTDAQNAWLMPRQDCWWGSGPTAVDALQALAAMALSADRAGSAR